jgi:diguanylate cyclase (GGDEF)-like protein
MIDLDHFKQINDQYGHDAGDAVLVAVARAIRDALRPGDFCARMGGEEFCVVLAEIETDAKLLEVTELVRQAIEAARPAALPTVSVTASVGALRLTRDLPVSDALRFADQATYRAKADGRNRVTLHAA